MHTIVTSREGRVQQVKSKWLGHSCVPTKTTKRIYVKLIWMMCAYARNKRKHTIRTHSHISLHKTIYSHVVQTYDVCEYTLRRVSFIIALLFLDDSSDVERTTIMRDENSQNCFAGSSTIYIFHDISYVYITHTCACVAYEWLKCEWALCLKWIY